MEKYNDVVYLEYCYEEIKKNLGTMYDSISGKYVLENWDKVTAVVRKGKADEI